MTRIRPTGPATTRTTSRVLAAGLLAAGALVVAPAAATADEGDPAPVPAPRFLPGSSFGGYEVRTVHVGGTVHLTDVDPFFDEDDHCELGVGVDLLLTVAPGPDSLGHGRWDGDCDGASATLAVSAAVDEAGDVHVRLYLLPSGGTNFPIFDVSVFDDLHAEADVVLGAGERTGVHLDAGASSHAEGTADLDVSVG